MKVLFTLLFFSFSILLTGANNPDETFSTIKISGEEASITIDIPWSITEAVATYRQGLIKQDKSMSFKQHLQAYIHQNFMLIQNNNSIKWSSYSFLDNTEGNRATLKLTYKVERGKELMIQNTLLFNINKKQKNYHKVTLDKGEEFKYLTKKSKFNFKVDNC